jgi:hypothetical protein
MSPPLTSRSTIQKQLTPPLLQQHQQLLQARETAIKLAGQLVFASAARLNKRVRNASRCQTADAKVAVPEYEEAGWLIDSGASHHRNDS